jgi:Tol biopolymer transport system component
VAGSGPRESTEAPGGRREDRLDSWKEIAAYFNRSVRTVVRWEQEEGLPVHRLAHRGRGSVFAIRQELDAWLQTQDGLDAAADHSGRRRTIGLLGAGALAVAGLAAVAWMVWSAKPVRPLSHAVPLSSLRGIEVAPALAPGGRQAAFAWDGGERGNLDIYAIAVEGGKPSRLTTDRAIDTGPAWSPDGGQIAFLRLAGPGSEGLYRVLLMPAGGGAEQHAGEVRSPLTDPMSPPKLVWSPDGRGLIVPHSPAAGVPAALHLLPLDGGPMRRLTAPPGMGERDVLGAVSPRGRALAYVRSEGMRRARIFVMPMTETLEPDGEPRLAAEESSQVNGLRWAPDGERLLYACWRGVVTEVRRVRAAGGKPETLATLGASSGFSEFTPAGDRIVYTDFRRDQDIWGLDLEGGAPSRLIASSRGEGNPAVSPDGSWIAFSSTRSGAGEIWVCAADGSRERRLTKLDAAAGMPRWHPDGSRIVFNAQRGGNWDVYVISASGGSPARLTSEAAADFNPTWSRDGRWVYFTSNRSGSQQIWRMAADGGGPPLQMTAGGGWLAFEGPEDGMLYYSRGFAQTAIWKVPLAGGAETPAAGPLNMLHNFVVAKEGIYYQEGGFAQPPLTVWLQPYGRGGPQKIAEVPMAAGTGMDLWPGVRPRLLFAATEDWGGDLWTAELPGAR